MTSTLPLQPLIEALALDPAAWASQLADRLDVTTRTVHRWAASGMSVGIADRIAVALDLHPALLWDEYRQVIAA